MTMAAAASAAGTAMTGNSSSERSARSTAKLCFASAQPREILPPCIFESFLRRGARVMMTSMPVFDALVLAGAMMALPLQAPPAPASATTAPAAASARTAAAETLTIGASVEGRPIRARRLGEAGAPVSILVVGCVHGNERAGNAVLSRLRDASPPSGAALWLIGDANPDGCRADTRQNANGVDLNRNFPYRWERIDDPTYHSGDGPLSEPESQALHAFMRAERPV